MLSATIGNNIDVGDQLQNYRLAIAATAEYTDFFGGQTEALAAIQTFVDDVNAIFEAELSIRFDLVSGLNTIFTDTATDGYTNGSTSQMLNVNTGILDTAMGGNNTYDIGHVFGTTGSGGSGLGGIKAVNDPIRKGEGASVSSDPKGSSWLNLVAHELAHQFGAEHTFNGILSNAGPNREADNAYEPGSGSTLMSYAGISGADDLQPDPDNYLHAASFEQIQTFIAGDGTPNSTTTTGNAIPTVDGGLNYTIPAGTPFELTAVGSDADIGDTLTYTWEQLDLGPAMSLPLTDNGNSPLFRSFLPSTDSTRTFPRLPDLVNNVNTAAIGEAMPTMTRDLNFRTTVRDGNGGVNSDDVLINVVNTGSPFAVTAPNAAVSWTGGSTQNISWDVAGTTGSGINTSDVAIDLSLDGGLTYPFVLAGSTTNDGSHTLTIPNIDTTEARVRVRGVGNVFFDISDADFTIISNASAPGVTVVESGGNTSVSEEGVVGRASVDTYTLALNTVPSGNVEVTINGGAQLEVSLNGVTFGSSVVWVAANTSPQTLYVRGTDDSLNEGIHFGTITHMVTATADSNYPVGTLINPVTASIADDELHPVVGVDFDQSGSTSTPENWTKISQTFGGTTTGLVREDGITTSTSLTLGVSGSAGLNTSVPAATPLHSPSLEGLDGNHLASDSLTLTWGGLAPGRDYNIYLLTSEWFGSNLLQNVTVTAGITVPSFTQDTSAIGSGMLVNSGLATSTKTLEADSLMVQADTGGTIQIVVTDTSAGGAGNALLSGAAIQEIGSGTVGFGITQTGDSTEVSESGTSDTFDVVLTTPPTDTVVIDLTNSDTSEISVSAASLTFDETNWNVPQTVTVAGVDDALEDGAQTTTLTLSVNQALTADSRFDGVGDRLMDVVNADNEAAFLVGVDFAAAGNTSPGNWTLNSAFNTSLSNLIDEAGNATSIDLSISGFFGTDTGTPSAGQLPTHSQSLAGIDGNFWAQNTTVTMTWSDLNASNTYEVYVFGLDRFADNQNVTITGAGTPVSFAQNFAANQLFVNGVLGSSSLDLGAFAETVTPTGAGQITIEVTSSSFLGIGGLAIREVPTAGPTDDFGDAPSAAQSGSASSYPVTLAEDGARHTSGGPTLGTNRDSEADGVHSAGADADDTIGSPDDEDGVTFTTSIIASTNASRIGSVNVDLQNADGTSNRLDAWIDFNRDGDWNDPGEQILTNYNLGTVNGLQSVSFAIPQDAGANVQEGTTYARFRLSTAGSLSVTGAAADGEVEDHAVTIDPSTDAILLEPFDHSGQFSVSEPFFSIGDGSAFFGISDGAGGGDFGPGSPPTPTVPSYTGAAVNFLTGMDMDATATGHPAASLPITATWSGLNITGQTGLQFGADFASFDEGASGDPGGNIEPSDFIRVEVQIDGGGFVSIMEFRGNNTGGANAAQFSLDTDGDGSGDGTLLADALRNFTADIVGTGNLLDLRISMSVSDQDEDFAIDNVTVTANNPTGPFVVDTIADESDGDYSAGDFSLREAIERANTHVGADEIQFAAGLSGQTITLTVDQLLVTDDLTITGLGASNLTVSGGDSFRVFDLQHAADVVIDRLTITGGRTTQAGGTPAGITGGGAGIRSSGTLLLSNSIVTDNHTTAAIADGGGIFQVSGTLTLDNSEVSNNSTDGNDASGGGISAVNGADVTLIGSTVTGNSTDSNSGQGFGGGIYILGGDLTITESTISNNANTGAGSFGGGLISINGNLNITQSTISGNTTTLSGGGIVWSSTVGDTATVVNSTISGNVATSGSAGGIFVAAGTFNLEYSTVTANTAPTGQGSGLASFSDGGSSIANTIVLSSIIADNANSDVDNILSGGGTNTITSSGFNLVGSGNAVSSFGVGSDLTGVAAGLGPLANNGGPTFTHALQPGSLAIGTGDTSPVPTTDQRGTGFSRLVGANVDIGAFELQATNPSVTLSVDNANIPEAAGVATFAATLSDISGETVTVDLGLSGTATGSGTDYNASGLQIVIPAGSLTGFVTVTAVQDVIDDDAETVIVDITGVTNGTENGIQQQTTTIVDDDDAAALTVSIVAASIDENAGTTTGTVTRNTGTTGDLTVNLSTSDTTEASVPSTVTILNGNSSATFTITGVDDAIVDGTQTVTITASVAAYTDGTDTVDVTDNDTAGIVVTESGPGTTVSEDGTTDTFDVVLTAQPLTDVVITVTSGDIGEATVGVGGSSVGPKRLFGVAPGENSIVELNPDTGAELNRFSAPVTLSTQNDQGLAYDGSSLFFIDGTSANTLYELNPETGAVIDSDTLPAPTVRLVEGLTAFRGRIFLLDSNNDQIHEFDPVTDTIVSTIGTAFNSDGALASLASDDRLLVAQDVSGTNLHEVDPTDGSILNSLGNGTLNLIRGATAFDDEIFVSSGIQSDGVRVWSRAGAPIQTLPLPYTVTGLASGFGPASTLTFTPSNWNAPQTVTITGVDDPAVDGDQVVAITVSVDATASDDEFDSLADQVIQSTTTDNDTPGFTVIESGGSTIVSESGSSDTFSVVLDSQPTSNVELSVTGSDSGEALVDITTLTFTPLNWNIPQIVTVTGVDDFVDDADQSSQVTISVIDANSNDAFDNLADQTVNVTTTDDDIAGFMAGTQGGFEVSESGTTTQLTVVLTSQPSSNVTINLTNPDPGEISLAASSVTFTPANWNIVQAVTVTGVPDGIVDGNQLTPVRFDVDDAISDDQFDGKGGVGISIRTLDIDTAALTLSIADASISENGGTTTATVSRNTDTTATLEVTLVSNDTGEATVVGSVTIAAGQTTSPAFTITGVDDANVDGTQTVTITATASAHTEGVDSLNVLDDDSPTLTVVINSASVSEGDGTAATTVTVTRNTPTTEPMTVALNSSDTSEANVPATVTIPAGQASFTFDLDAVDDTVVDGTQTVTITATEAVASTMVPDVAFGSSGIVATDLRWGIQYGDPELIQQPDGKLLAIGRHPTIDDTWQIVRLNSDGSFDSGFGTNGVVNTAFTGEASVRPTGIAVDASTGRITVTGVSFGGNTLMVARYTGDGTLDSSFGTGGRVAASPAGLAAAVDVILNSDGTTLLVGTGTGNSVGIVRLLPDGTLDASYGAGGVTTHILDPNYDIGVGDVVQQPDGKVIITAGAFPSTGNELFYVVRINTDGSLDTSFDGTGYTLVDFGVLRQRPEAVKLQPDGKIVIAGRVEPSGTNNSDWATVRLNTDGSLDTSFSGDGKTTVSFSSDDQVHDLAILEDGKILLVGGAFVSGNGRDRGFARLNSDGTLDSSFGTGGKFTLPPLPIIWEANWEVVVQPDGKIVTLVGYQTGYQVERFLPITGLTGSDTLAVIDDDAAALTLSIADASVSENGGTTTATVSRNTDTTNALTVTLVSNDAGEATVVGSVTIAAGLTTSPAFTITGVDDTIVDGTQTVTFTATATAHADGTDTLDVTDDDAAALTLSIADASISENGGTTTATVTRNTDTTNALTVTLVSNDTSEAAVIGTVTIAAGQTTSPAFNITGVDDTIVDGTQTVTITATATAHADGTDTLDVTDDDAAALTLSIADASISENGGTTTATVTRNTDTTNALTVTLVSNDTSEATVIGTVTIAAGQTTSPAFNITGVDDTIVDGTQTATITATATAHADGTDTLDVTDDDAAALTLSIAEAAISENGGTTTATVSRNTDPTNALTVTLVSNDTSEATVPAVVTIPAGADSVSFTISGVDDAIVDGTQLVTISASASDHVGNDDDLNVTDDDTLALTLTVSPASISENGGTATGTIARNDGDLSSSLEITLTSDDTSEATVPATVTISAGLSSATFSVDAVDDAIVDGTQTATISVGASGYAGDTASLNITDDDTLALTLSITPGSISENGGTATGTVTRNDADWSSPLVVDLTSSDSTEAMVSATVTILAGQASADFTITAVDDAVVDGTQVLSISVSANGYTGLSAGLNVTDDESPALTLSVNPVSISENGGTATGTVTRNDEDLSSELVVNLSSSDTTEATVPASVTIPVGQSAADFTISAVDDAVVDGTQVLSVSASATGYTGFSTGLNVTDDDVLALTLSIDPASISENSDTATGTVSRNDADLSSPLTVTLESDDTTEASTPSTVTIPAGESSATFQVNAVDDDIVDGTQTVSISANAASYVGDAASLEVTDDDVFTLTLSVAPAIISENGGSTTGTVFRNDGDLSSALVVDLNGSDSTEADVPASVTIAAGQSSASFTINAVDDAIVDGTQSVSVAANATGYATDSASLDVTDDDVLMLKLTVSPASISENGGTATGTVLRNDGDLSSPLEVTLTSGDTTEATVPTTVTIAAGQSAATFTVSGVDDAVVDGTQSVDVTATAASYLSATSSVDVTDDDVATLTLTLAAGSVSEAAGTGATTGTVTRNASDLSSPLSVTLASSDSTEATTPTTVTIATGQSSATFSIDVVDDLIVDGTQTAVISADADDYTGDSESLDVTDDDVLTLTLSVASSSISENGGTALGTVSRNDGDLSSALVVNLTSDDTTEATTPATVTIGAGQASATFTISGVDDAIVDGLQTATISADAASYVGDAKTLAVTDDDAAGITVSPSSGNTSEDGTTATFTVVLNSQPTADVTIDLSSSDTTEGTVTPTSITFTAINWQTAQTITVTGEDDAIVDGNVDYSILTATAVSTDTDYNGLNADDVAFTNTDNDTAALTVSIADASISENGGTTTATVSHNTDTTNALTVTLVSNDTSEATVISTVTIPAGQTTSPAFNITGVDDTIVDGTQTATITATATAHADGTDTLDVTDDDAAALTLSIADAAISENGGTTTATVTRNTDTTNALTVTLVSNDTSEATVISTVTIPAGQTTSPAFNITGVDDTIVDGTQTATITATATAHADGTDTLDVTDDDAAALTLSIADAAISENGGTTTATVTRNTDTTNALTVTLVSNDTSEATVISTVTIPAGQTTSPAFNITGVDDTIVDGTQTVTFTATATAHADGTDTLDVTDDDAAALTLSIADASISENGGTTTATVTRNTDTTNALTVTLVSNDTSEAAVIGTVTIAAGQTTSPAFNITGVDDTIVDGTQTVTITATATAHADGTDTLDVTDDDEPSSNLPPDITSITTTSKSLPGDTISITTSFTDQDLSDVHTATIDWGDGTVTQGEVSESNGTGTATGNHQYADAGIYTITVTINDGNGGTDSATSSSLVTGVKLVDGVLYVIGTDGRDHVNITNSLRHNGGWWGNLTPTLQVNAKLNQGRDQVRIHEVFDLADVDEIVMQLCDGDDHASLTGLGIWGWYFGFGVPTTIIGGDGDDHLFGGSANDILIGGDGDDKLYGGRGDDVLSGGDGNDKLFGEEGHDVLIGGAGRDKLSGGSGNDLLIGGLSTFDNNLDELDELLSRWAAGESVDDFTSQIIDDYDKDELNGGKGHDTGFGGFRDKLKL
ncbi:choice-of-anchor Q domain-containing protein [Fuerstiella marisgermanici]|nr:Calx-beta domain-containing protein [Fuerstiella marisgermanici]